LADPDELAVAAHCGANVAPKIHGQEVWIQAVYRSTDYESPSVIAPTSCASHRVAVRG
jgi:hypothetical protein